MTVRLTWDITLNDAKERLIKLQTPLKALTRAIAGRLESSTHERFETETAPDGKAWKKSNKPGGKTLTVSGLLNQSISSAFDDKFAAVGTNLVYAGIHQRGGEIKPVNAKALRFKVGGQWVCAKSVKISARPFLGISDDDIDSIQNIVKRYLNGEL